VNPAKAIVSQETEREQPTSVSSGRHIYNRLRRSGRYGLSTRMFQVQFLTEYWTERSVIWRQSATPAGHPLLSLQVLSEPTTNGSVCISLPTPCAQDGNNSTLPPSQLNKRKGMYGTVPSALLHLGQ